MFVAPMLKMGRNARKAIAASGATLAASQSEDADAGLTGFFSQAVKAAKNLTRKTGNAQGFKNDLTGKGQVKPDELKAMGFDEHFGDRTDITKEEVQQFINDNQINIDEVRLGQTVLQDKDKHYVSQHDNGLYGIHQPDGTIIGSRDELEQAQEMVDMYNNSPFDDNSKYGKYTLDEGESGDNYRELLMQLSIDPKTKREIKALHEEALEINAKQKPLYDELQALLKKEMDNNANFANPDAEKRVIEIEAERDEIRLKEQQLQQQIHEKMNRDGYQSGHFDEDNILTHLRMKDRVDADGNKTLLLEEVQSDWHQQGKKDGYANPKKLEEINKKIEQIDQEILDTLNSAEPYTSQGKDAAQDIIDKHTSLRNIRDNLLFERNKFDDAVPDAPFKSDDKSSWYNLAMKRGLIEAAEGDYDKLAITTGRQQAERYDLSKTIGSLKYQEDMVEGRPVNILTAYDKHGMRVFNRRIDDPEKELPSIIGKDATKSLLEAEPYTPPQETRSIRSLRGQELNVGGEGMKEFYDRKLPNTLNKLVKQDGVKVGQTELAHPSSGTELNRDGFTRQEVAEIERLQNLVDRGRASEIDREYLANYLAREKPYGDIVHSIDITPEMRERVKKGLPLFSHPAVGAVTLAGGAALGSGALVDMPSAEMPKYTSLYDDSVSVGNTMNQELSQQKANMSEEELSDYNFNNLMAEEARMRELGSLSYGKASPELMAYRRRNILPSLEEVGNQIKLNAASYLDAISSGDMSYTGLPDYEFSKAQGVLDELPSHRDATVRKAVEPMLKEYIDPRDKRSRKDAKNIANMIF